MSGDSLSKDEVKRLVYLYKDPGITNELYTFGTMLLSEIQQRSGQIDAKAGTVLAWSTGILAFLFAYMPKATGLVNPALTFGSAVFTLLALLFAFNALRTRNDWTWPSDKSWLEETALTDEDEVKRYHIRVMHDVRETHLALTGKKGRSLYHAEKFLIVGATLLFGGIAFQFITCALRDLHLFF
jgi:hypothetical protein